VIDPIVKEEVMNKVIYILSLVLLVKGLIMFAQFTGPASGFTGPILFMGLFTLLTGLCFGEKA
jgi:hypothetical protein